MPPYSGRKTFFFLGIAFLIAFLLTGQWLQRVVVPHFGDDTAHRMMARASHLYILFISLMIILSSLVPVPAGSKWIGRTMSLGRALLAAAGSLLLASFFLEHSGSMDDRALGFYGCVASLAGVLIFSGGAVIGGGLGRWRAEG